MGLSKIKSWLPILLGALSFLLLAAHPYILDLIQPAKSVGLIIAENAKDLMDTLDGKTVKKRPPDLRQRWSNILVIAGITLLVLTMVSALFMDGGKSHRLIRFGSIALVGSGLFIYLMHLAIGLLGALVLAVLIVIIVILGSG